MPAKTKSIAQGGINYALLCIKEGKVQTRIKGRVVCKVVDGWWYDIVYCSQYTCYRLNSPRST